MIYRNEYFVKILFSPRIEEYPDAPINTRLTIITEESPLKQASKANECLEEFISLSSFLFYKLENEDNILYKHGPNLNTKNIAGYILDLMALLISSNLGNKKLFECYYQALLIIQKIIFYLSQMKVRFVYQWNELFDSLFLMINYICKHVSELKEEILLKNIINMLIKTVSLLLINGKIFMDNMNDYDLLIKKIINNKENCLTLKFIKINLEGLSSNENLEELRGYLEDNVLQFFKPIDEIIETVSTDFNSKQNLDIQIKSYSDNVEFKTNMESIEGYYENPHKRKFFIKYNKLIALYLRIMIINDTSLDDFIPSLTTSKNSLI
ncbi:hypothetical protein BCR36DRAFT_127306 [Piromyces finnis]|uniref:Armadillo-like helical domain-containing protein n=1 Tax=Piromyces finnis TaxID=1754191 RepID=A0A1Y1V0E2_9FUNG|nr:hypothetical protein BCR36DRAFT_127306 [Piromyces finnis]|eukprot:ORX44558.1 hypothetical protein BCR36DRAFT_127306 [Piromyces finnis]